MIRITKVFFAAMFSLAMLVGANEAHALLIDGFGNDQGTVALGVIEATGNSGTDGTGCTTASCSATDGPLSISDTDLTNAFRTLTITITDDSEGDGGAAIKVSTDVFGSRLSHSQDEFIKATSQTDWTFSNEDFSGLTTMNLVVDIFSKDVTGGSIEFTLCDGTIGGDCHTITEAIFATGPQTIFFDIGTYCANITDCTSIDTAQLVIIGSIFALDMSVDFVGMIPEPATLALFGVGLVGIGFMYRRRRRV